MPLRILKIILTPFAPLYAIILKIRNMFFDRGIFKVCKFKPKIISVGNITIGGSGKTPMVIYLIQLLQKQGLTAAVLSRGYGRQSRGCLMVSDGLQMLTTVEKSGDEIYHTASKCKVPAAVSENRCLGAKLLQEKVNPDFIILDDAFQHRWIHRDVDLVLFDQDFLLDENEKLQHLVPNGFLREPFKELRRADAIIVNQKFKDKQHLSDRIKKYFGNTKTFYSYYTAVEFVDVRKNERYSVEDFKGQKSLIISGIANPESFFNALNNLEININNKIIFKDHQNYTEEEIQKIRKLFYSTNSYSVITTEKDSVKLSKFSKDLDDIDIYYLQIELRVSQEKEFAEFLSKKLSVQIN